MTEVDNPELAVVVLSVGAPPELSDALVSLGRQDVPLQVVVVNSGGGDLTSARASGQGGARFIEVPERLWPGAARNLGVQATTAPYVAFMASDHILTEGWCAGRLAHHRAGNRAVACAVVNNKPNSLVAWAHHLSILVRRLPGIPAEEASLHGVSYARSLFERHGTFRTDLRIGEDTEFNARLSDEDRPVWAPSILTIHQNTTNFIDYLKDQYRRGRRSGFFWPLHEFGHAWVRPSLERFREISRLSYRSLRGRERLLAAASFPILLIGTFSHGLGFRAGYLDRKPQGKKGERRLDDELPRSDGQRTIRPRPGGLW